MKKFFAVCSLLIAMLIASLGLSSPSFAQSASPQKATVLLFGGTGRLGSDIAKSLLAGGHKVVVLARETSSREKLAGLPVDYVIGDVLDLSSLEQAFATRDFDVAIDALARGSAGVEFYKSSAENITSAASGGGVQQIILHGSVGAGDSAVAYAHLEISEGMQNLMDAKTAAEQAVAGGDANYTIIRNGHLLTYGTPETGNADLYEDQQVTGSVSRQGLARLTNQCILNPQCYNKIYHAIDKSLDKHD